MRRSNVSRHGGGFVKFLVGVALLASLVVLGWGVFANWSLDADGDGKSDGFTLRVLDPAWWSASKENAEPLVQEAKQFVLAQKEEIWGDGGWVDQGEDWLAEWQAQRAREQAADDVAQAESEISDSAPEASNAGRPGSGSVAPIVHKQAKPQKAPRTQRLEQRIVNAEDHFAEGLEYYRAADPSNGGWTDKRANSAEQARDHFIHVRKLLQDEGTLDEYAALSDHDSGLLKRAQELLRLNQKLLYAATKSSGGL